MDRTEVRGSLREMWDTRPSRPRDGRKLGGVAVAIARRYDVDPVIVRVAFAVTAFYGVGLLLYLIGMVALPDGRAGTDRRGPPAAAAAGLAVFGVVALFLFVGLDGSGVLVGLVALGLLFLLHRSRGSVTPPPPAPAAAPAVSLVKGEPTPPSWDPLGAAPFAWDLPEPGQAPPPPPERRLPVTAVTLALALLAGAVTTLLILTTGMFAPSSVPIVLGVVLAVLGLGLLIGSFLHAGRGLVPVAAVIGLITWGAVAAPLGGWSGGDVEYRFAPATVAAVAPTYERPTGSLELDLSELDLTTGTAPLRTSVRLGAGEVLVRVPDDADVTFTSTAGLGEVSFAGQDSEGPGAELTVTDLGEDGVRSGRPLEITVEIAAGDVEVRRG